MLLRKSLRRGWFWFETAKSSPQVQNGTNGKEKQTFQFRLREPEIFIAVVIVISIAVLAFRKQEVPQALSHSLTAIIGYYFGKDKKKK